MPIPSTLPSKMGKKQRRGKKGSDELVFENRKYRPWSSLYCLPSPNPEILKSVFSYGQEIHSILADKTLTDLPTPKYFCQYSKQPTSYFQSFHLSSSFSFFFLFVVVWMHDQSIKTEKSQRPIFLQLNWQEKCENSHFLLYRHIIKLAHYDTRTPLLCLYLLKLFWTKNRRTLSPKVMHSVLLSLMPTRHFWSGSCLVRASFLGFLYSSSSRTALNSNWSYLKMANFHKASNTKSMFTG